MEKLLPYKSTIKSRPFLYKETKVMAKLIYEGFKDFEIKERIIKENLFQNDTEMRIREIASVITKRIDTLDSFLTDILVTGDLETSKLVTLYSIMKTDRLFFEFMHEVFREKILLHDFDLQDKDMNIFFNRKKEQSEVVASWKDYTFYKLKQVYYRILLEAGLVKSSNAKSRTLIKTIINKDFADYIVKKGDEKYFKALIGEA